MQTRMLVTLAIARNMPQHNALFLGKVVIVRQLCFGIPHVNHLSHDIFFSLYYGQDDLFHRSTKTLTVQRPRGPSLTVEIPRKPCLAILNPSSGRAGRL